MSDSRRDFVFVNNEPRPFFAGITVRLAIGPERAKQVENGVLAVFDEYGHLVGLDGTLAKGDRIFLRATPNKT